MEPQHIYLHNIVIYALSYHVLHMSLISNNLHFL